MNEMTKTYRKEIADMFVNALQEKALDWKKGWQGSNGGLPENAISGAKYKGANRFKLWFIAMIKNYEDSRWATFKQIKSRGWQLEKGSKGVTVEYWFPYDAKNKEFLSWDKYNAEVKENPERENDFTIRAKYYKVFSATKIKGIPPLPVVEKQPVIFTKSELIEKISVGMNVPVFYDGGDRAYYSPGKDTIHLPKMEAFDTEYDYQATALHELAHSTGAASRLNRDLSGHFGSEEYAYEELVAEISSCFMCKELQIPGEETTSHKDNHKAYVQSWIRKISEKPESLIMAIREAEKAADYLGYHADLIPEKEHKKNQESSLSVKEEKIGKPVVPSVSVEQESKEEESQTTKKEAAQAKISPELKERLRELEKSGHTITYTKDRRIRIPGEIKKSLTKEELSDVRNYFKEMLEQKQSTIKDGGITQRKIFIDLEL